MILNYVFVFLLGLCAGSFLNVCIYRIPRKKSILFPPSACPECGKRLGWFELIPVLSFILQKGRCRGCGGRISRRYPLVELITGLLFALICLKYGVSLAAAKMLIFASILIIIAFVDIDFQIIPNVVVLPGAAAGLAFGYREIWNGLLGLAIGFGIIAVIILASRGGMGWGDAKLLGMIGAFLGWKAVLYSLFMGSLFGSVAGVVLLAAKRIERKTPIPFGPFLSLGALLWVFFPWWFR